MTDAVREQYEAYPYPPRDPADEAKRLIAGSPSGLDELNHWVFGGRRDFARPFRALVAGGGTGDAAIMMAQQLADRGGPGEVVYVDVSSAARRIAEARAEARGLGNIRFETATIADLPAAASGPFDYVDCCGVLHHLESPADGLAALARVLADDGGMGLMLYAPYGRTGVYPMQAMLETIAADGPASDRLETARRLMRALPPTNWLRANPFLADHLEQGDAGLFDLFLNARDRPFTVAEAAALADGAGLRVAAFVPRAAYDPASYVTDPRLLSRLGGLRDLDRAAFAERLAGNMRKHVLYAVKATNPMAPPDPRDPAGVPRPGGELDPEFAARVKPGQSMTATIDGITLRRPLPPLAGAILRRIDGTRTLAEIHADVREANPDLDWDAFADQFEALYEAANGLGTLHLAVANAG